MSKVEDNYDIYIEGIRAIQEALYMYRTLLNYKHFVIDLDIELGDFSVDKYIDCDFSFDTLDECDQVFLREASAVKLICQLLDSISINEGLVENSGFVRLSRSLVEDGRLKRVGTLGILIEELLKNEGIEQDLHVKTFDEYVINKFKQYLCLE